MTGIIQNHEPCASGVGLTHGINITQTNYFNYFLNSLFVKKRKKERKGGWILEYIYLLCLLSSILLFKEIFMIFPFSLYQSPEEIDKEKVHLADSERKMDPAEEDTNVYTEKHSDNLFKRTEVLAGE